MKSPPQLPGEPAEDASEVEEPLKADELEPTEKKEDAEEVEA